MDQSPSTVLYSWPLSSFLDMFSLPSNHLTLTSFSFLLAFVLQIYLPLYPSASHFLLRCVQSKFSAFSLLLLLDFVLPRPSLVLPHLSCDLSNLSLTTSSISTFQMLPDVSCLLLLWSMFQNHTMQ